MKYGVNTFIWTASFQQEHLPLLPKIKAAGFDGMEVSYLYPAGFAWDVIRKGLADNGLECTICSVLSDELSLISEDAAIRAKTREHLEREIEICAEVGGKMIAGPLYTRVGYLPRRRRTDEEWKNALERYQWPRPALAGDEMTLAIGPV